MRRLFVVAASGIVLVAGGVFAGEVKGPPGDPNDETTWNKTNETAAPAHANSNCAYSGLNDFDTGDPVGQLDTLVQTAADSWKFYGLLRGAPGKLGLCKGGTNEDREK